MSIKADKMELSFQVAQRVQIEDVHIIRAVMQRAAGQYRPSKLEISFSVAPEFSDLDKKLRVTTSFRLQDRTTGSEGKRAFCIETVYLATYRLNSAESLSQAHFQAFAEINGIYNTWPFWREFVQNASARMGLPGLTIPVLSPVTKEAAAKMQTPTDKMP